MRSEYWKIHRKPIFVYPALNVVELLACLRRSVAGWTPRAPLGIASTPRPRATIVEAPRLARNWSSDKPKLGPHRRRWSPSNSWCPSRLRHSRRRRLPLASSANCLFQASKPAAVLPHWAASALTPRHASTANAVRAAVAILPLIIPNSFAPFERRLATDPAELLGGFPLRPRRRLLRGRFLHSLLTRDGHQHFLLATCRLAWLLRLLRGLHRFGGADAPA